NCLGNCFWAWRRPPWGHSLIGDSCFWIGSYRLMATAYANTYNLKLSFTTWVCPEWTVAAIVDGMTTYGYDGVELRIGKGHLHGVELDSPADYLSEVRKQFDAANM